MINPSLMLNHAFIYLIKCLDNLSETPTPSAAFILASSPMLKISQFKWGLFFRNLAFKIAKNSKNNSVLAKTMSPIGAAWLLQDSFIEYYEKLRDGYIASKLCGDFISSALCFSRGTSLLWLSGKNCFEALSELTRALEFSLQNQITIASAIIVSSVLNCAFFLGLLFHFFFLPQKLVFFHNKNAEKGKFWNSKTRSLYVPRGEDENAISYEKMESLILQKFLSEKSMNAYGNHFIEKSVLYFSMQDFEKARECILEAKKSTEKYSQFQVFSFFFHCMKLLICMALKVNFAEEKFLEKKNGAYEISKGAHDGMEEKNQNFLDEMNLDIQDSLEKLKAFKENSQKRLVVHGIFAFFRAEKRRYSNIVEATAAFSAPTTNQRKGFIFSVTLFF